MAAALKDQELFCSLMGIGGYLREDVFRDRYGVVWARKGAPDYEAFIRSSASGERIWESPDDILGSVSFSRWELACSTLQEMVDFTSMFGSTLGDSNRLYIFYDRFEKIQFEHSVLPWLEQHNNSFYVAYNDAMELVATYDSPSSTPPAELWRWGVWFNALIRIYTDLRKSKTPPDIPKHHLGLSQTSVHRLVKDTILYNIW